MVAKSPFGGDSASFGSSIPSRWVLRRQDESRKQGGKHAKSAQPLMSARRFPNSPSLFQFLSCFCVARVESIRVWNWKTRVAFPFLPLIWVYTYRFSTLLFGAAWAAESRVVCHHVRSRLKGLALDHCWTTSTWLELNYALQGRKKNLELTY